MTTTQTRERGILFSAPMVRALLKGSKTQTRRIVKPSKAFLAQVDDLESSWLDGNSEMSVTQDGFVVMHGDSDLLIKCPYGQPGDRLWVREKWAHVYPNSDAPLVAFAADDVAFIVYEDSHGKPFIIPTGTPAESSWKMDPTAWKPSIHMPRWASRITLEITDVRVERVEDISPHDALAEGVEYPYSNDAPPDGRARDAFLSLFYDINKRAKRGENPWVWVVGFKRVEAAQ